MFYIVFLVAALGLLIADITGALSVSFWVIGGLAIFPFAFAFGLLVVLALCTVIVSNSQAQRGRK